MTARRRIEIASYGVDETKQIVGTSPYGGSSWLGLRVPSAPTVAIAAANGVPPWAARYLFLGCAFSVGDKSRARIIGWRQWQSIGCKLVPAPSDRGPSVSRPIVMPVTTPGWSFPDATVTTHLRRIGPPNAGGLPSFRPSNQTDGQSFRKGFAMTPSLLYQSITLPVGDPYYVDLTSYVPPNAGRPYGTPLTDGSQLGTVYGLDTEWKSHGAWNSLDIEVRGPDTVAAFLSVAQTEPTLYPPILSSGDPAGILGIGLAPEDAFTVNMNAISLAPKWWSVGVALIVEVDSLVSEVRAVVGEERTTG